MSIDDLPPVEPELEALLAAEREVPPPPAGLEARLLARLGATLGWGGGGGGAVTGGLGLAKLMMILVAVIAATGAVVVGYVAVRGGGHGGKAPGAVSAGGARPGPGPRAAVMGDERSVPTWFGDVDRAEVAIAGRVLAQGEPVAGARVLLTSNATRAGLLAPLERQTDARGGFDFGPHRAAVYDVTATAPDQGEGHVRVDALDPTATPAPGDVTVELPGCADALFGIVKDSSGGVIAGAEVRRARGAWADVTELGLGVVTDPTGAYELCTPPGPITAIIRADGYGTMTVLDTVLGRRQLDVELMPAATLVGRVVRASDGSPVADAAVWLRP